MIGDIWERERWAWIEEKFGVLRDSMKVCTEKVCGKKRVGGMRRKRCE